MDEVEITDPVVLNSLRHPESLNSAVKKPARRHGRVIWSRR